MTYAHAFNQVLERAHPSARDHRHRDRVGHGPGQIEVEAGFCPVAIHGSEQDFAGAKRHHLACIADRLDAGRLAATMGEDLKALASAVAAPRAFGIDRNHDALSAEFLRRCAHEVAILDRCGVDRHLVGAGLEKLPHIVKLAHSATNGVRHEAALSRALHHIEYGVAIFMTCSDVEEAELVGAGLVIGPGGFYGIAGVAQIDEVHALDDAAVLYVEAWNEADLEHR